MRVLVPRNVGVKPLIEFGCVNDSLDVFRMSSGRDGEGEHQRFLAMHRRVLVMVLERHALMHDW